jgi:hypothetical protein
MASRTASRPASAAPSEVKHWLGHWKFSVPASWNMQGTTTVYTLEGYSQSGLSFTFPRAEGDFESGLVTFYVRDKGDPFASLRHLQSQKTRVNSFAAETIHYTQAEYRGFAAAVDGPDGSLVFFAKAKPRTMEMNGQVWQMILETIRSARQPD